ncbi:hypothetical protein VTO42DRAFT_8112 [Malbranchea cinnamomea]
MHASTALLTVTTLAYAVELGYDSSIGLVFVSASSLPRSQVSLQSKCIIVIISGYSAPKTHPPTTLGCLGEKLVPLENSTFELLHQRFPQGRARKIINSQRKPCPSQSSTSVTRKGLPRRSIIGVNGLRHDKEVHGACEEFSEIVTKEAVKLKKQRDKPERTIHHGIALPRTRMKMFDIHYRTCRGLGILPPLQQETTGRKLLQLTRG